MDAVVWNSITSIKDNLFSITFITLLESMNLKTPPDTHQNFHYGAFNSLIHMLPSRIDVNEIVIEDGLFYGLRTETNILLVYLN